MTTPNHEWIAIGCKARALIHVEIEAARKEQIESGFTAKTDDDVLSATWREERDVQERRALAVDRPPAARRRALVKLAALAMAQIEAMDRRSARVQADR